MITKSLQESWGLIVGSPPTTTIIDSYINESIKINSTMYDITLFSKDNVLNLYYEWCIDLRHQLNARFQYKNDEDLSTSLISIVSRLNSVWFEFNKSIKVLKPGVFLNYYGYKVTVEADRLGLSYLFSNETDRLKIGSPTLK